jgi:hypothetical protein
MKCPHCAVEFHDQWRIQSAEATHPKRWALKTTICPACQQVTIELGGFYVDNGVEAIRDPKRVFPIVANRGPVSSEVPKDIAQDYIEACSVLSLSAKASATLSRRCLQSVLHQHGYNASNLAAELDLLLKESDPLKTIPLKLRASVDAIRNFGNFGAHPIEDTKTLQVIDVEPTEAEWCLEIVEDMFEHFYVAPAAAKARKAQLDAKLAAAGKPRF